MTSIKLLDIVALNVDLPEYKLRQGQVGTVVEILGGGKAFEVEFSDGNGRAYESLGLRPDQLIPLYYEPQKKSRHPLWNYISRAYIKNPRQ